MESGSAGVGGLDDGERLYRRVPNKPDFIDDRQVVLPNAFRPTSMDTDGLSLFRAAFYSGPRDIVQGARGKSYWVLEFRAADLRAIGLELRVDPRPDPPGHVLIANIRQDNFKDARTLELVKLLLVRVPRVLHGPFENDQYVAPPAR